MFTLVNIYIYTYHICFFPTCQVRVVRFYVSCLLLSSSPLLLLLLNRDPRCTVFSVGPQPRPSTPSVPCRTSTTTIPAQCSLPDLNHDHPRPVFPAGPQPRPSTPSVPCRTSTASIHAKCSLQHIAQKIHASEADGRVEKLTTRQRNKERVKMVLKKLVHLMNSLQVKSGSELVFPMLFDHMSFATHRCWETNLKVAYAKTLSAWQDHFKGSLKALHEKASVSQSIGFLLPSLQSGRAKELPVGWLIQPKPHDKTLSANAAATMEQVEQETGEDHGYIYISPGGQRFTSLQQALQYAQNDKLRNRMAADMKAVQIDSFDHNSNIQVQFTSNHEDYMHRGEHPIMQAGS